MAYFVEENIYQICQNREPSTVACSSSPIVEVVTRPLKDDISIISFLGFFVARSHAYSSHKSHMFPKSFLPTDY